MTDPRRPAEDPEQESGPFSEPDDALIALLTSAATWEDPPPDAEDAVVAAIAAEARRRPPAPAVASPLQEPAPTMGTPATPPTLPTPATPATPATIKARARWMSAAIGATAGAAAAVAVLVAVIGLEPTRVDLPGGAQPEFVEVALDPADDGPVGARADLAFESLPDGSRITVKVTGLPPAAEDEWYEVLLRRPDQPAVSAGSFHLRGGGERIVLWAGIEIQPEVVVEVVHQPQGTIVLSGTP